MLVIEARFINCFIKQPLAMLFVVGIGYSMSTTKKGGISVMVVEDSWFFTMIGAKDI